MKNSHEEDFMGYTIYVEESADRYNSGFNWSVCKDEIEFESGVSFSIDYAVSDAKEAIKTLIDNSHA